ncbi:hypothetical protein WL93_26690 [Burkholderia diffusa]|nr:hypothetical protein WL93_26690 [Burkholderia diffusa]
MTKFNFTREFYIPQRYREIQREDDLGVIVVADETGLVVMGFSGKRQKSDFHIKFRTKERVDQYVADWLAGIRSRAQQKIERREARKSAPNPLKVGDILQASWGYEQTNVDYYQVTAAIGKHTVEIQEVSSIREATGDMQGISVPAPGNFIGAPMRKRVDEGGAVKIHSWGVWARKKEAKEVAGLKVFEPDHWTAYA